MALTESHAGTDLGLLKTGAKLQLDGSYKITGTKIFISSGDHDFGGNIIHLVLARLPDAPDGVKGLSLFLVPKFLSNEQGEPNTPNDLSVGALEQKMGIHAQPTCVINYNGAKSWLIGAPNCGLSAMFTMMNTERLFVGIQGLGIGEAAYQGARQYACERLQGRSLDGSRAPIPIIEHPDVRKMLLTARALTEAGRALSAWTALQMDRAARDQDKCRRATAEGFVALLTPVVKAALSDFGFESAVVAQQVLGGHGYIKDWGMEQLVRDARITQIYEGTNGVQAMDLVGRKLAYEDGNLVYKFIGLMRDDVESLSHVAGIAEIAQEAASAIDRLVVVTNAVRANFNRPGWTGASATDYLRLFALVSYGWLWVKMSAKAAERRNDLSVFAEGKLQVARFFIARILPQTLALEAAILAGPDSILVFDNATI
ncbi:acyl-CoA dehydrogenase [Microvirga brassicacearum]|uniref:Acyl-CoA dehydrogenase n=1 Tax=Microvirga brassicacearum TaxID=2580413 RepID=A0A5N3PDJ7_9HYPH|nr:acyl-CoA dehydrogenase [Microvirga brassicacearum]KAB0267837.1 acyl-CoA dehydrogenase [Microvirga brassicacearum]